MRRSSEKGDAVSRNRCSGCKFWENFYSGNLGECRRMPPTMQLPDGSSAVWPKTSARDWCGEFQAKPDPE